MRNEIRQLLSICCENLEGFSVHRPHRGAAKIDATLSAVVFPIPCFRGLLQILLIAFQRCERQVALVKADGRQSTTWSEEVESGSKGGFVAD